MQRLAQWRDDPVQFVWDQYGQAMGKDWSGPDAWQLDTLQALPTYNRIAMKACKGPGKSCLIAWVIQWFLACYPNAKGFATSITGDNLRDNLWSELALWQKRSRLLSSAFQWTAERYANKENYETWLISARTWSR